MDNTDVSSSGRKDEKKKPFNKKKWREQKYNRHKKIEQWQEKRKKAALHKYHKLLRKEDIYFNKTPVVLNNDKGRRLSRYQEAMLEYEKKCQEKERKIEEARQAKDERLAAQKRYRALRADRQRKLSRRTVKGQPIMKERLELLLEKIQNLE